MVKVQGWLSISIGSNCNTVGTGIIYLGYGCTEGFPDVSEMQSPEHWPFETAEILQCAVAEMAVVQP